MKTCEEYVLNQLKIKQQELDDANKRIQELENNSNNQIEEIDTQDMKCIYLSDKPNYYYVVNIEGAYRYNDILKDNNLTPQFVEESLKDNSKFDKLCKLKKKNDYGYGIGEVTQHTYNYLLKTRNGKHIIILSYENTYMYDVDKENEKFYLNEKDAQKYKNKKVREEIEYYLKNYKEKFEPKEEK